MERGRSIDKGEKRLVEREEERVKLPNIGNNQHEREKKEKRERERAQSQESVPAQKKKTVHFQTEQGEEQPVSNRARLSLII